jgi:uncharacterized membrane protein
MDTFIADLVDLINNFEPASYLPEIDSIVGWIELLTRICVMAAPVIMLVFGLTYWFLPAKEANHEAGYRFYFGMGSVEAWRFTQKLAGIVWTALGLVLSVIMFLISGSFRNMDGLVMLDKAVACILWEIGLMAAACVVINILLIIRYDRKGNVRWTKKEK